MKKHVSPVPTPRAAALSQSANRFSAGATSAWQRIVGNSPRLAAAGPRAPGAARTAAPLTPPAAPGASRVALEPQRAAGLVAPAAEPETVRQVGWREVDRAVGMSTKRKYSLLGIGFGPKVSVFETERVKLPVYQEANRNKRYYAAVQPKEATRIKRDGFQPKFGGSAAQAPASVKQFNTNGHVLFFGSEAHAHRYGKGNMDGDYTIVEFVMPEYQEFTPDLHETPAPQAMGKGQTLRTSQHIPASCIKHIKAR